MPAGRPKKNSVSFDEMELIIAIAREHNVGDIALGRKIAEPRLGKNNYVSLKGNIEPMDIVSRAHPEDNFQFTWCPFKDREYFQDCRDDGYKIVLESEWVQPDTRWDWEIPDNERSRWGVTKMLVNRDMFLMYRTRELWQTAMRERSQLNDNSISNRTSGDIERSQRAGVSFEGEVAGQPIHVPAPSRTHTVS